MKNVPEYCVVRCPHCLWDDSGRRCVEICADIPLTPEEEEERNFRLQQLVRRTYIDIGRRLEREARA